MENSIHVKALKAHSEMLEDEIKKLDLNIKHHEDNLRFIKSAIDSTDESIIDLQVSLGRYHTKTPQESTVNDLQQAEEETLKSIIKEDGSATAVICQMKFQHSLLALKIPLMKEIVGIVATLCRVNDADLSRRNQNLRKISTTGGYVGILNQIGHCHQPGLSISKTPKLMYQCR